MSEIYKFIIGLIVVLALFPTGTANADTTFFGDEGVINTPSSEVISDRSINLGLSYLPGNFSYALNKPNLLYSMSLGFLPRTEVGIVFNQIFTGMQDIDNPYLKTSSFDRSIFLKFQVLEESQYVPSLAIGGRDILSNSVLNREIREEDRQDDLTALQQIFYLAIGKKIEGFKINLGYSYAPGIPLGFFERDNRESFRVSGIFSSLETPKFFSVISGMIEYDSLNINYGVNLGPIYGLQAKLVMIDLNKFNLKLSWSADL